MNNFLRNFELLKSSLIFQISFIAPNSNLKPPLKTQLFLASNIFFLLFIVFGSRKILQKFTNIEDLFSSMENFLEFGAFHLYAAIFTFPALHTLFVCEFEARFAAINEVLEFSNEIQLLSRLHLQICETKRIFYDIFSSIFENFTSTAIAVLTISIHEIYNGFTAGVDANRNGKTFLAAFWNFLIVLNIFVAIFFCERTKIEAAKANFTLMRRFGGGDVRRKRIWIFVMQLSHSELKFTTWAYVLDFKVMMWVRKFGENFFLTVF